ncbi:hypothetical protein [Streptomyces sp. NPDC127066]|uniref:hypothetical protein n=1 Tax=Streptomyces sp. NPDC127066 TaxID=3347125 RepID=UPI003656570E
MGEQNEGQDDVVEPARPPLTTARARFVLVSGSFDGRCLRACRVMDAASPFPDL